MPRCAIGLEILVALIASLACSATISLDAGSPAPQATLVVNALRLEFIGQDGANYAGRLCSNGTAPDNVHLRLEGLRPDVEVVSFRVDEPAGGGVWATPCDPISNWPLSTCGGRMGCGTGPQT